MFESRYDGLSNLLRYSNYTNPTMGELQWFFSLIKNIQEKNHSVIHCNNDESFLSAYRSVEQNKTAFFLIMDYLTIPKMISHLSESLDKIYCMCYWGRHHENIKELGAVNNRYLSLKNVLTPFDYGQNNTFLGYDMSKLCKSINKTIFNKIGLLWGKELRYIDQTLVKYLTERGMKFYSVSNTPVPLDGVTNLGIIPKDSWLQLLHDVKFVLGSGNPHSGPTILEALYYKTPLVGPTYQFPESIHNKNIHFIDNLQPSDIYTLLDTIQFVDDPKCNNLSSTESFNTRITQVFGI